ncbi:MAG: hypothetical protein NC338_03285 [Firmicutes bacterium]|nr:hypothetical protein [Bacillota bacterium]MCM1401834.1 hypothetical protein [Bacteroides sp.]MCM1477719.1 hypothetical protein [Bacteroides sp.]
MSLINSLKRALGFPNEFDGDDDDDLLDDELNDDDEELRDDPDLEELDLADETPGQDSSPTPPSDVEIAAVATGIFDVVLKYFNSHQPEIVQKCLDLDVQRKLLIEEVDTDLRERLAALADIACRRGENRWAEKQQKMGAELMKLKSEYNTVRQQREEFQSAQLSATRQKRALTDRIKDLENQVVTLEAEREQLQLENRSMANRIRNTDFPVVGTPQPAADSTELQKQIETLQQENNELKEKLQVAENSSAKLQKELEEARRFSNMGNPERDAELEELEKQLTPLKELKDAAEAKVIALTRELKESDATIKTLQKRVTESAAQAQQSSEEIESLRATIEKNLYTHATVESELRKELELLKQTSSLSENPAAEAKSPDEAANADSSTPGTYPKKKHRKKRKNSRQQQEATLSGITDEAETPAVKISAIDELMESTDWFVAPEPVPLKKDPEVEENFGYKEPQKKNDTPADDRQLTLW